MCAVKACCVRLAEQCQHHLHHMHHPLCQNKQHRPHHYPHQQHCQRIHQRSIISPQKREHLPRSPSLHCHTPKNWVVFLRGGSLKIGNPPFFWMLFMGTKQNHLVFHFETRPFDKSLDLASGSGIGALVAGKPPAHALQVSLHY